MELQQLLLLTPGNRLIQRYCAIALPPVGDRTYGLQPRFNRERFWVVTGKRASPVLVNGPWVTEKDDEIARPVTKMNEIRQGIYGNNVGVMVGVPRMVKKVTHQMSNDPLDLHA